MKKKSRRVCSKTACQGTCIYLTSACGEVGDVGAAVTTLAVVAGGIAVLLALATGNCNGIASLEAGGAE